MEEYKYFIKNDDKWKDIPEGVVIILLPKEKKFIWFYYRVPNKQWFGDFIDFESMKKSDNFEEDAIKLILEQIKETIAKLDEKVN